MKLSGLIACWVLLLCCQCLRAAVNPRITRIGVEKGLSNNSIRCIYQDRDGFFWFGTFDGLNRYDGYEFKVFRNKLNDSTSQQAILRMELHFTSI